MSATWFFDRLRRQAGAEALVGREGATRYEELLDAADDWDAALDAEGLGPGRVVAFDGDFSRRSVSLLLALIRRGAISVPLASAADGQKAEFMRLAGAEALIDCRDANGGRIGVARLAQEGRHELTERLAAEGRPGLILFSSGSTGRPKAMLHDFHKLLEKYEPPRWVPRMISFLLLDHIGGINTLLYSLANGGAIVTVEDRRPETVCRAIETSRVEALPTSPTFLNLLLLSGACQRYDLSSLKLITYGTEVMPASTLARLRAAFPDVRLQQTYGLSELGILRSKSREDGSLWVKVGGEGFETKVVDGVLWIRARSALVGYLNAPSPFDAEGWFNTKDAVDQDGEWLRFLGRVTDMINVGGRKVHPAEVETALLELDGVIDATVRGEPNAILGHCVVARVNLSGGETADAFKSRMRRALGSRLAPYMIPVKVEITESEQFNARGKKIRLD